MVSQDRLPACGLALAVLLLLLTLPAACFAADPVTGTVVATAGDVNGDGFSDVVVGIPTAAGGGEVDVYLGSADGSLTLQRRLTSGEPGSNFGAAVAGAGDVNGDGYDDIVIGQPTHTHIGPEIGQAWIFLGGPTGIGTTPLIQIEGLDPLGHFGAAVSTAGDMNGDGYDEVVVGAPDSPGSGAPGSLQGRATIYLGGPFGPGLSGYAVNGNGNNEHVGASVSGGCDINGDGYDDVILGAPFTGGGTNGEILLVRGSSFGPVFILSDQLGGPIDSFDFGASVAEVGDWNGDGYADVVVGAPQSSGGAISNCGKAYLVPGGVGGLPPVPTLLMTGNQSNEFVGQWVACAGDRNGDGLGDLAVGAPGATGPLGVGQGYVAVHYGTPTTFVFADTLYGAAAGAAAGTCFSGAGELAGNGFSDLAIVSRGAGPSGRVDFFPGGVIAPQRGVDAFITLSGATENHPLFGWAVAAGGDLNGDGYGDVAVGAPNDSVNVANEGSVSIFTGFRGNTNSNVNLGPLLHSGQSASRFGAAVDFAGDVDGDGYDDIVVGAPGDAHAFPGAGRAYLFRGRATGVDTVAAWTADGAAPDDSLGFAVCGAGGLNRDGYADIAVGAPGANGGAGQVRIYYGSPGGPTNTVAQVLSGAPGDSLGYRLAPAGDVNGDGYDDLLIGAPGHQSSTGEVLVLYGGPSAPGATVTILPSIGTGGERFGAALAGRGDLDADGVADVAIGAPASNLNGLGSGLVEIHHGSNSGLTTGAWQYLQGVTGNHFGSCLSFGDYNADGHSDLAVGAPGVLNNPVYAPGLGNGAVYMCTADTAGILNLSYPSVRFRIGAVSDGVAFSLSADLNGDGFADLVDADPLWEGSVGVMETFVGGGGRQTLDRLPRQRRSGSTGPLALEGGVDPGSGFALALRARTPAGRQRLKVQWQAGPASTPFSALPVQTIGPLLAPAPDSIGAEKDMSWNVTGIPAGTPVHWRMRVRSHAGIFAYTPWLTPAGNASTLADLDVIASPVAVAPLDPTRLALAAPAPNPAHGAVALAFDLPRAGEASLAVFDARGRLVRRLVHGRLPAGAAEATWDGKDDRGARVGAGVYFALLRMDKLTASRRIVRLP